MVPHRNLMYGIRPLAKKIEYLLTEHDIACTNEDYFEIVGAADVRSPVALKK